MIRKFSVLLILLVFILSISTVCAFEDNDSLAVEKDYNLTASSHTITDANYNQYFDLKGNLVASNVNEGDTINLNGEFSDKNFTFKKKINIVGSSSNNLKNSIITLSSAASGSSVKNINIQNTKGMTYGIFLNSASNCLIQGCNIINTGQSSYGICLGNNANYNKVFNNYIKTYGITYGHGSNTRSTPALLLSGSHYNNISNNHVEVDDANAIYLSSYSGGPLSGGNSNFNIIYNNTVHYNVLPTSWAYGIQAMGNNNTIDSNTVIGGYRGVSTAGSGNIIIRNNIINLTGADFNHPGVESGGEYAIVAGYNSIVRNNNIISAKVISTGGGISAIDNSIVENNKVNVTLKGRGIVAGGSNVIVRNNIVFTQTGSGIYQKDEGHGLVVDKNNITSDTGVGILIEKINNKRMPSNVTVRNNVIKTNNDYAIDASGVQSDTSDIDIKSNIVYGKLINTPAGVIDTTKPTFIFKGTTHYITPSNIRTYINDNGGLTSQVNDSDILNFQGKFYNEVIYITKSVKLTGSNVIFYNSTFKVTSGGVLIENLTIINDEAERVNAWGIFVNQASGVRIVNNNINVYDPKAAYAVYILESSYVEVLNNTLTSRGDYLTFTLLSYESEDCSFINNKIQTTGTSSPYRFSPEKCIDGNELVLNGKSYCIDGNELVIDGVSYCIDGNELFIDGVSYCIDGNELVVDGVSYCIDGNELVIDGKTFCIDGNELVIDGKSYGSEYSTSNAHVVSEIYQTYGILLLYSSNIIVSQNDVNATSLLNESYSVTGSDSSHNSVVGIDLYFNCHNNTVSQNNVYIKANDNYIYGMGVLGYFTGHNAPVGQGATNNKFTENNITLYGVYCAEGIIIGDESENTLIENNTIKINSSVSYGVYFEMSQKSNVTSNKINLNSDVVYGILGYDSSDNYIVKNDVSGNGKNVYGILFSNGNRNKILHNTVFANATGEEITMINIDTLGSGNGGIYLKANSTSNNVEDNNVTSILNYAVLVDDEAINNIIYDNYLDCEKGIADGAVNNSNKNTVKYNYKFIADSPIVNVDTIKYLEEGEFNLTFGDDFNGAYVKLFDADNKLINESIITDGYVSFKKSFSYDYTPANYIFSSQLFKENYKTSIFDIPFTIENADPVVIFENFTIIQGDTQSVSLKVLDSQGNPISNANVKFIMIRARNIPMGNAISNAKGIAQISYELPASVEVDEYSVRAEISPLNYFNDVNSTARLNVLPRLDLIITGYSNAYIKSPLAILKDSNGDKVTNKKVSVKIGSVTYSLITNNNGEVVLPSNIKSGSYKVNITSQAERKYNENDSSFNILVVNPISGDKDYSLYYGNTVKYKVRVFDITGNPASGKSVVFKINGKSISVKSDKSGYASYSVKLVAGKYTITANYLGFSVSNKITFLPTLSANNIAVKKSKVIKFSAKLLNKKGKILKNKKITFKIKGKTYKAKTNKKGIATAHIKNLKVGKYTITSSYGGCTIKNTIKIKR